ncbi:MAG: DUF429 domain-containing protein [Thiohalocapsa sp.]|jgi:hypothetical protein
MSSAIVVIGIDCAAQAKNMGVAVGESAGDRCRVREVFKYSQMSALIDRVASVLGRSSRALLSLDAPLGWPVALISALQGHRAGRPLGPNADLLFCRDTDREIRARHALKPLDVGADRIARVARSALELLEGLRNASGEEIPLLWQPGLDGRAGAIEVYPKATLKAHGLPFNGYKGTGSGHRDVREDLVTALGQRIALDSDPDAMIADDDMLDAAVCVLAGHDFLIGTAKAPADVDPFRTEGWIWARDPC